MALSEYEARSRIEAEANRLASEAKLLEAQAELLRTEKETGIKPSALSRLNKANMALMKFTYLFIWGIGILILFGYITCNVRQCNYSNNEAQVKIHCKCYSGDK
jgi:hypothetical protein